MSGGLGIHESLALREQGDEILNVGERHLQQAGMGNPDQEQVG